MSASLHEFTKKLLDTALEKGFTDAEVYMSNNASLNIMTFEGEINKFENSASRGISFRGTYNNKMGYAYSEWLDEDAIDIIITEAMQNSEVLEEAEQDKLFSEYKSEVYPFDKINGYNQELRDIPVEDKITAAFSMEKSAIQTSDLIQAVDYNIVEYQESDIMIANTYGMNLDYKSNLCAGVSYPRAVKDGETKTGGEFWIGLDWKEFNPEKVGREASEIAIAKFGAKSVKSRSYKIVMKDTVFSDFLSTFSSVFLADNAQKGLSLLAGKMNEKIASDNFTLRDDPVSQNSINAVPFDAEGVATFNKAVIENGVFKTFLHNLKTASKDGVKSTGNASKAAYKSPVKVAPKNLYVLPGELTKEKLLEKVGDGLYITDLAGLHSGANAVSGDFSLSAEGYIIENGKITKPVEQITVAGNFFGVIKDVEAAANNLRFSPGGVGSPDIYIKSLDVAGSEE